jgi:predicted SAM-dependent methyltransferase
MAIIKGALVASTFDLQESVEGKFFDVIFLKHCFEYIFDFDAESERIHSILSDDGVFCIAVPPSSTVMWLSH